MSIKGIDDLSTERVLANLELTRGLTIQLLAIGTLGMLVWWTLFSGLHQVTTGNTVTVVVDRAIVPPILKGRQYVPG